MLPPAKGEEEKWPALFAGSPSAFQRYHKTMDASTLAGEI